MAGVGDTFKSVIDQMTNGTDLKLGNLLDGEDTNLTHNDLTTCIDKVENRWNIRLVSYDMWTLRVKPSSDCQLPYSSSSFGIFDK